MFGARVATAVGLLVSVPPAAGAHGNPWEREVRDQIRRASQALVQEGAVQATDITIGLLNREDSETFRLALPSDASYVVLGVCDEDCRSFHLILYNEAENYEMAAARAANEAPVLRVTPPETRVYHLKSVMAHCGMNPCWYGIAIFRKREEAR